MNNNNTFSRTKTVSIDGDIDKLPVQLEFDIDLKTEPEKIVRPEYNVGKMAPYIFANPWAENLSEVRSYKFPINYNGETVEGELVVSPTLHHQTPTTTTMRIFLGLIKIWEMQYREKLENAEAENIDVANSRSIMFSTRQLCHIIDWSDSGDNYRLIQTHLDILSKTSIDWLVLFQDDDGTKRVVKDMRLVQANNYVEQQRLFDSEQYDRNHEIVFSDIIVEGMVNGRVRPFNFQVFKSIRNPSASSLYTQLDFRLSKQDVYTRTASGLLFDDLGLTGEYLKYKSRRKYQLERLKSALDGKEIGVSEKNPTYLQISIAETSDGKDWKLIARKVAEKDILKTKTISDLKGISVRPLRKKTEAREIAEELYNRIRSHSRSGKITVEDFIGICLYTPTDILYTCMTDVISEYSHGKTIKKSLSAIFFHAVKEQMDKRNLPYPK